MRTEETILLVDADDHARGVMRARLASAGFRVCAEASDRGSALHEALVHDPDLCLMRADGIVEVVDAVDQLARAVDRTAVVVLVDTVEDNTVLAAVQAGAQGCLPSDTDAPTLGRCLRAALRGEAVIPRRLIRSLLRRLPAHRRASSLPGRRWAPLTPREQEVLIFLRDGLTTSQVAGKLFVEPVTIRSHVASAVRKLGVADRDEAIALLEPEASQPRAAATTGPGHAEL